MIRVKRIGDHDLPLPARATAHAAGYDLSAADDVLVLPHSVALIPTGFAWEIDAETDRRGPALPTVNFGLVRDRSRMAVKSTCFVVAGVIDGDYRGEVNVALRNVGSDELRIKKGQRIAQMIIAVAYAWDVEEAVSLTSTERGEGGFGSTGE